MSEGIAIDAFRREERADVYKKGQRAGAITRTRTGNVFAYDGDYRGAPVASTLPRDMDPRLAPAGAVPTYFAGLLPEGRRLVALQRATKTSADDDLTLLLAVGGDTVGDVQIVVAGQSPEAPPPLVREQDLGKLLFADLFAEAAGGRPDRVGLPGVQDKVSVNRVLSFPLGVGGERFILKLNPREYPGLVENEAFFLAGAQHCGIKTAEAMVVHDREGQSGLLVKRFDRIVLPDKVRLLAQEDACQASDRYPADKYNLTTEEALAALAGLTFAPRVALLELVRQVAFAYLTGNGDMHAKNLSVVEVNGEMRASPAYDIPTTHPYGDTTMAMSIDGRDRENITRQSILNLADQVSLPRRAAASMLDVLLRHFVGLVASLEELPLDSRKRHKLRRLMTDRASKLA